MFPHFELSTNSTGENDTTELLRSLKAIQFHLVLSLSLSQDMWLESSNMGVEHGGQINYHSETQSSYLKTEN